MSAAQTAEENPTQTVKTINPMTIEEKRAAVAKALGWEAHQSWTQKGIVRNEYRWRNKSTGERSWDIPETDQDANTRPEMLKAMTFSEKADLCNRVLTGEEDGSEDYLVAILELSQPAFFELFGKIKGLW